MRFVHRISSSRSELSEAVTTAVRDPSVAALLIAKASQAAELGVELRIAPDTALPALDDELSGDVATVVGNLVDNAMDAAATAAERWVEVGLGPGRRRRRRRRPRLRSGCATGHGARGLPPRRLDQGARTRGSGGSACRWSTWCAPAGAGTCRRARPAAAASPPGSPRRVRRWWTHDPASSSSTTTSWWRRCTPASWRPSTASRSSGRRPRVSRRWRRSTRLRPGPRPAGRLPAGHDRPGGAAPAARRRVAGRRHRHQRGPGRRQHPQRPARRGDALPGEAVRPRARSRRGCGTTRRCAASSPSWTWRASATSTGCSAARADRPRRRPRRPRASPPRRWSWCGPRWPPPVPTACRPPSAASAPAWPG